LTHPLPGPTHSPSPAPSHRPDVAGSGSDPRQPGRPLGAGASSVLARRGRSGRGRTARSTSRSSSANSRSRSGAGTPIVEPVPEPEPEPLGDRGHRPPRDPPEERLGSPSGVAPDDRAPEPAPAPRPSSDPGRGRSGDVRTRGPGGHESRSPSYPRRRAGQSGVHDHGAVAAAVRRSRPGRGGRPVSIASIKQRPMPIGDTDFRRCAFDVPPRGRRLASRAPSRSGWWSTRPARSPAQAPDQARLGAGRAGAELRRPPSSALAGHRHRRSRSARWRCVVVWTFHSPADLTPTPSRTL